MKSLFNNAQINWPTCVLFFSAKFRFCGGFSAIWEKTATDQPANHDNHKRFRYPNNTVVGQFNAQRKKTELDRLNFTRKER